ncbi:hypothetical protein [Streptomyces parvus]|uniref:hypothetical protein n=1 Tax=Streptomyces parvus TaxID=66428 RepID=UPI002101945F|nr:hypothetical protein [Streptomyces parvus]MCQ1576627.1 hypothetical protein [Streptomyces parvus]
MMHAAIKRSSILVSAMASLALLSPMQPAAAVESYDSVSDNCDIPQNKCSYGDLHLHYNTIAHGGYSSARASFYGNIYNYAGQSVSPNGAVVVHYKFVFGKNSSGNNASGTNVAVKNQAGSVENCAPADSYRVYYNSGYAGSSQFFWHTFGSVYCAGGKQVDLNSKLHNNNASQHFA